MSYSGPFNQSILGGFASDEPSVDDEATTEQNRDCLTQNIRSVCCMMRSMSGFRNLLARSMMEL